MLIGLNAMGGWKGTGDGKRGDGGRQKGGVQPEKMKNLGKRQGFKMVVGLGFEPRKASASRFTVCPVWPLRYPTWNKQAIPV